ncbi:MAG: hypothetical protein IJ593_11385, partial [Lachnospiraceae bacterium]|nr:hypothetical protein [Lachnospiraceae bacterium]
LYVNSKIPKQFVGYKICQITDLNNTVLNTEQTVDQLKPDIVIINGNISNTDGKYDSSVRLINKLAEKYRVFYTLGELDELNIDLIISSINGADNIENKRVDIDAPDIDIVKFVKQFVADIDSEDGQMYLEYITSEIEKSANSKLELSGLGLLNDDSDFTESVVDILNLDSDNLKIVANSQYKYFNTLSIYNIDLLISSGSYGIDKDNAGYLKGLYTREATTMSLSGGIGNFDKTRFLNMPEVVLITLSDGTIVEQNPLEKFIGQFINNVPTKFDNDEGFKRYVKEYNSEQVQRDLDRNKVG